MTDLEAGLWELEKLNDLLAAAEQAPVDEYVGGRLMVASIRERRSRLMHEYISAVAAAEAQSLDITLEREGSGLNLVAAFLDALQTSISSIAQALSDRATARGVIPHDIQEQVGLRLQLALPGSLQLRLVPSAPTSPQQSLLEAERTGDPDLLSESVTTLFSVLGNDDVESTLQLVASLGPRASGHVQKLANVLQWSSETRMHWRSYDHRETVQVDRERAGGISTFLAGTETHEDVVVMTGRLVGGSLVRDNFELEVEAGSVISGKADDSVLVELDRLFGDQCTATMTVSTLTGPSGETRTTYRLTHLAD